jgi:hypothetical protein
LNKLQQMRFDKKVVDKEKFDKKDEIDVTSTFEF